MTQSQPVDVLPQVTQIYQSAANSFNDEGDISRALFLCTELIKALEISSNISWTASLKSVVLKVRVLLVNLFTETMQVDEALVQTKLVFCEETNGTTMLSFECCEIFKDFVMDRMMIRELANETSIQIIDELQQLLDFAFGPEHPLSMNNRTRREQFEVILQRIQEIRNDSPDCGYESFGEDCEELHL